jgi:hypothetical protein
LLAALAAQSFDRVISDSPRPSHVKVSALNHLLGESSTTFFSAPVQR